MNLVEPIDIRTGKPFDSRRQHLHHRPSIDGASIEGWSGRARGLMGGAFIGCMLAQQGQPTPTARDYVQSGLVSLWDGIENDGYDKPHKASGTWVDACGSQLDFEIGSNSWVDDGVSTTYDIGWIGFYNSTLMSHLGDAFDGTAGWTAEFVGVVDAVRQDSAQRRVFLTGRSDPNKFGLKFVNYSGYISAGWSTLAWNNRRRSVDISSYVGTDKAFSITHTVTTDLQETIYINGQRKYSGTVTSIPAYSPTNEYFIFNAYSNNGGFTGIHHCYRLYSGGGLTEQQVAANYAVDKARFGLP